MIQLTKILPITLKLVDGKKVPIGGLIPGNRINYVEGMRNFAIYMADYPDVIVLDLDTKDHMLDKYKDLTYTHETRKGWHCFFKNTYRITAKRQKQKEKYDLLAGNNWCFYDYHDKSVATYIEYNTLPLAEMPEELYEEVKTKACDIGEDTVSAGISKPLYDLLFTKAANLRDATGWKITNSSDLAYAVISTLVPYSDDEQQLSKVLQMIEEIGEKHSTAQYIKRLVTNVKITITAETAMTWRPLSDFRACLVGGKKRFIDIDRSVIVEQSEVDFYTTPNTKVEMLEQFVRTYPHVKFLPNQTDRFKGDTYNLFDGFIAPHEGTGHEQYLNYIKKALCKDNTQHYDYIISYIAHMVQKPEEQPDVAIVLFGESKGTGKDTFHTLLSRVFKGNGYFSITEEILLGRFNSALEHTLLGVAEELVFGGSHKEDSKLKTLITSPTHTIEHKGINKLYQAKNYLRLIITSNHSRPVRATDGERRFFALRPSTYYKGNFDFWLSLYNDFSPANLMHYLLEYDISSFNPRQMPASDYLQEIVDMNKGKLEERIEHWFSTVDNDHFFTPKMLFDELTDPNDKYTTQRQFTGMLKQVCGRESFKKAMTKNGQGYRVQGKRIPTVEELAEVVKHNHEDISL